MTVRGQNMSGAKGGLKRGGNERQDQASDLRHKRAVICWADKTTVAIGTAIARRPRTDRSESSRLAGFILFFWPSPAARSVNQVGPGDVSRGVQRWPLAAMSSHARV